MADLSKALSAVDEKLLEAHRETNLERKLEKTLSAIDRLVSALRSDEIMRAIEKVSDQIRR